MSKNKMDLIDRATLPDIQLEIPKCIDDNTTRILNAVISAILMAIKSAPTVDAEPVRHGSWTPIEEGETGHLMECSVCKTWIFHDFDYVSRYCPHCGAKMDGKECVPRKCGTCSNDGWDMPQCRECNEENGFKWYKRKMDAEVEG